MKSNKSDIELLAQPQAILGEGAWWDHGKKLLYWVDILGKKLFIYNPLNSSNKEIFLPEDVGAVVAKQDGDLVLAVKGGFALYSPELGNFKMVAEVEKDILTNRFNDGKCDPAGRFWAGSMDYNAKPHSGNLYCLDKNCQEDD